MRKVRLEIGVNDDFVQPTIDAILAGESTPDAVLFREAPSDYERRYAEAGRLLPGGVWLSLGYNAFGYVDDELTGEQWTRTTLDEGMASASCAATDLNGDGRLAGEPRALRPRRRRSRWAPPRSAAAPCPRLDWGTPAG